MDSQQNLSDAEKEAQYQVKLEGFEGPLDLLLHLVKTSEIDIYDIPIAHITKQYMLYLSLLVMMNLDNITEFVEMATTLILIKSRAMLPVEFEYDGDEEDPRQELIKKLLEYQKYKMAAGLLETMNEESLPFIERNHETQLFKLDEKDEGNWKQLSVLELIGAFADVLNSNYNNDVKLEVLLYNFTVEDKLKYIQDLLENKESFHYFEIVKENMPKLELVCTFLALLELVKKGRIAVRQHKIFGDIHIVKKEALDSFESQNIQDGGDEPVKEEEVGD